MCVWSQRMHKVCLTTGNYQCDRWERVHSLNLSRSSWLSGTFRLFSRVEGGIPRYVAEQCSVFTCMYKGWSLLYLLYWHPPAGSKMPIWSLDRTPLIVNRKWDGYGWSLRVNHIDLDRAAWNRRLDRSIVSPVLQLDRLISLWSRSRVSVQQVYWWPPLCMA